MKQRAVSNCRWFCATLALLCLPSEGRAQIGRSVPPPGAETHVTPLAERYDKGGLSRWFLGGGYRDIWQTPIEIPVLDISNTEGGLTPTGTGGYGQTLSLKFLSADGLEYAVRSIDKDPTRRLDSLFTGTIVARIVQDQVAQFLPTAGLVVDPLMEATGILHPRHRLVVIRDEPALGEYRENFAGLVGMLTDNPQEGPDNTPGFAGSTRISGSDNFLEELEEGACNRADARQYLKVRLMDMVIGDRDRHEGQFRWARFPDGADCYLWQPIPEDRDQAFILNDGFMMSLYRLVRPQQVKFGAEFPSLVGLTYNGWELDRQILVELEETVWVEVAREIRRELTDAVIDDAVGRLPEAHYALRGEFLASSLKSRRDLLEAEAVDFYRLISRQAEVKTTDRDEHAVFEHMAGGDLRVTISYRDGPQSDRPFYDRTFERADTREVRVFLQGGDDFAEIRGVSGQIRVRAIGGGGDDRFLNTSETGGSNTRFYDDRGDNTFEGSGRVDERSFERPPATNLVHRYALDWGGFNRYIPQLGFSPDLGLEAGVLIGFQRFGFRKVPWATDNAFLIAGATRGPEFFLGWDGRNRHAVAGADLLFQANYSGINVLRFHGFGNDSPTSDETEAFKIVQRELAFRPALEWNWGTRADDQEVDLRVFRPRLRFGLGPVFSWTDTPVDENDDSFLGSLDPAPLGVGSYVQLGARAWFEVDERNSAAYPTSGLHLVTGTSVYPSLFDVEETFGRVEGALSTYLTPGGGRGAPTLALKAGGESVFGNFPFFEAAFLGGRPNVRGLFRNRFAGESLVYGNAEIRLPVTQFTMLFPAEFGILGAADAGRVFFDGDASDADSWHTAFGGGIWLSFLNRAQVLSLTVMSGDDVTGLYLQMGMHF